MANSDRQKLSTCPICGYTDTATDAEALSLAIEDHMRSAHNVEPSTATMSDAVKPTFSARPAPNEPPAAAPVANLGNAPSAGAAPPNLGPRDYRAAPGDPNPEADYPMDDRRS